MDFSLVDINSESRLKKALEIYISNTEYFSLFSDHAVSIQTLKEDMNSCPPNTHKDAKQFKLISANSLIIGLIDYIVSYPDDDSVYIGLVLIDKQYQGQGMGTKVISKFEDFIKKLGFIYIQLGVVDENTQAMKFWTSLHYKKLEEKRVQVGDKADVKVWVMRKRL